MKNAKIYNPITEQFVEFDYNKVVDADNKELTDKQLKDIDKFLQETENKE